MFENLNKELTDAQTKLEAAIADCIISTAELEEAKINLIKADSKHKKARLDMRIWGERVKTIRENMWNTRAENKLK